MKRNVLLIAGLAVLSTSAFASKARIEALSGNNGAANLYIKDNRNVFRNAATINTYKNYVVTEWGTAGTSAFDNAATPVADGVVGDDSTTSPRAEGGFFKDAGSLAYGLYLGNDGADNGRTVTDGANGTNGKGYLRQDNSLDLFLGGDAGLQWGARLHYASSKDEPASPAFTRKNTAFGLGLGVVAGAAEGYVNATLSDKSTGNNAAGGVAGDEWKQKPTFTLGGSYDWSGYTFFGEVTNGKVEETSGGATTTVKAMDFKVGAGRVMEINPTARLIMDASVVSTSSKIDTTGVATTDKTTTFTLPVTLGFEAEATSWLTLRGSVGQNVILNNSKVENTTDAAARPNGKRTNANTTTVNAGASLTFGKLALDGSIGTMATGTLNTDDLMSRVGVTYSF